MLSASGWFLSLGRVDGRRVVAQVQWISLEAVYLCCNGVRKMYENQGPGWRCTSKASAGMNEGFISFMLNMESPSVDCIMVLCLSGMLVLACMLLLLAVESGADPLPGSGRRIRYRGLDDPS